MAFGPATPLEVALVDSYLTSSYLACRHSALVDHFLLPWHFFVGAFPRSSRISGNSFSVFWLFICCLYLTCWIPEVLFLPIYCLNLPELSLDSPPLYGWLSYLNPNLSSEFWTCFPLCSVLPQSLQIHNPDRIFHTRPACFSVFLLWCPLPLTLIPKTEILVPSSVPLAPLGSVLVHHQSFLL